MHLGMPECHKLFLGHCDLDLWPSFQEWLCPEHTAISFDVGIPNLWWWFLLGWRSGAYHFESLWLWHLLLASFLGFLCYITAIFPQMCLMLDQFLWGHSSRVCDISCFLCKILSWIPSCISSFQLTAIYSAPSKDFCLHLLPLLTTSYSVSIANNMDSDQTAPFWLVFILFAFMKIIWREVHLSICSRRIKADKIFKTKKKGEKRVEVP